MVRGVLFDVDDTLVDFTGAARNSLAAVARDHLPDSLTEAQLWDGWSVVHEVQYDRYLSGELGFREMQEARMDAWARQLLPLGDPWLMRLNHGAMEDLRNDSIFGLFRLFDDALPTIERLRELGIAVGVVSNSDGDYQRRKLAAVGLAEFAAAGVFSGDIGVSKPDPVIFEAGLATLGLPAEQVWYVGDRWSADVLGAAGAGLGSVWINRDGRIRPGELPAERSAEIASLDTLPAVLGLR